MTSTYWPTGRCSSDLLQLYYRTTNKRSCAKSSPLTLPPLVSQPVCHLSPLQVSPQQQPGQLRNGSWKGSNYSFARRTWLLLASTHYYLSGILQRGARPTIHCNPFLPASLLLLSIWLSALMRARLRSMAVSGPMVSRETQDNGWIIKGSPVERKDFFLYVFAATHATYIAAPFLASPVMIPGWKWKPPLWV